VRLDRSLPPGEKWLLVGGALGVVNITKLEEKVVRELWRLRRSGGPKGRGMSLEQVSAHLTARGEYTSTSWLGEFYQATSRNAPKQPAA
jgi:hypothetical protein